MNRTQKFALNSITSMVSQIVVMLIGIITPRLMISAYGSEMNGLVSSLNQFIMYISLVEAGIGGAAIYSLYKPLADEDHSRISGIVNAAKKSYRQAGYIFSGGLLTLAVVYGILSKSDTLSFETIFFLTIVLGVSSCVDFFFVSGYRVLLSADQRNFVTSIITIFNMILKMVIICVMAPARVNIILLYTTVLLTVAVKVIAIYIYSKKQYPYIDKKAVPDKGAMEKRWDVIYQQILGMVQISAPTVLATVMLDLITVSIYSVYNMVISGINGILSIFISGLSAGFGDIIARGEKEKLKKTSAEFETAYYCILSVVYGLAFVLIMPFVSVYTAGISDANYYYPLLGFVIVLNGLLYNIKTPQSMLVISAGMYKEMRWRATLQGAVIIIGGIAFGVKFGIVGIMIGSCLSNIYRTVDLLFFTPKHITGASIPKTAGRMLLVFVNVALIALPLIFIDIAAKTFVEWIIAALAFGVYSVFVVAVTALIFDRKNLFSVVGRVLNIVKRRKR